MEARLRQKLKTYQPSAAAMQLVRDTKILLLVGISGAGKDTTKIQLLKRGGYHHIVSHTTRQPRMNHGILEQEGVDYHFVSLADAENMIDERSFIEAKIYSGNLYGTSVSEIRAAHIADHIAVTDMEVQGVGEYKHLSSEVTAVFLLPPDYETWQERLRYRYLEGHIDAQDMKKRMETAQIELRHALETDYFHFVVNDDLSETVNIVDGLARHNEAIAYDDNQTRALAERIERELQARL